MLLKLYRNILLIFLLVYFIQDISAQKTIAGYYPQYASSTLPPQNIRFDILTNIIHAFAWPDSNGNIIMYNGVPNAALIEEAHKHGCKVSISFGGGGQSDGFPAVVTNSEKRLLFVRNAIEFITDYGYDGIDIDWEFPDSSNGFAFTLLLQDLRSELNQIDNSLLLSIAITPNNWHGRWIEYEKLIEVVDWFSMMSYDYNGSWSERTGHNAPLYKYLNNTDGSGDEGIKYLTSVRQIPADKIVFGIPFFGKVYNSSGLNQTWDIISEDDDVLKLSFRDIQNSIDAGYNYNWDTSAQVPYYVNSSENRFISFDDTLSVRLKTEYAMEKNLKGVMIWEITQDKIDFSAQPLLESIGRTMGNYTPTQIEFDDNVINRIELSQNYPNPFNPSTRINFVLAHNGFVSLKVYNSIGQVVDVLVNNFLNKGNYSEEFNGEDLSSGIYYYTLITGNYIKTQKMVLLK